MTQVQNLVSGERRQRDKPPEGKIVAKALDGQRYPLPLDVSLCGYEVVRGTAALKGPMTYAVFIAAGI